LCNLLFKNNKNPIGENKRTYNILIWRACMEANKAGLAIAAILLDGIGGCLGLVNKVRIEYIKLVPLHNLGRWVVMVIVCLVVLVPLVTCMHPVEVLGLSRTVLVMPPIHLEMQMI
jgi:hypothetical protein